MAVRKDQRSQSSPVAAWLRDAVEKDPALGRMLEQLERVAGSDDPAVLVGPRGCGLERAARGVHFLSRRAADAVFSVTCGELLEASAEAELFGFDGGGHPPRIGLMERAGAGTVVLRDIDALPVGAQRALAHAVHQFSKAARSGPVPSALRTRLATASGQVAAQRESLARATAALDRAIDVLLPRESGTLYSSFGSTERGALRGGAIQA